MATVKRGNELLRLKYMRDDLVAKTAKAENADERTKKKKIRSPRVKKNEDEADVPRCSPNGNEFQIPWKFLRNSRRGG